MIPEYSGHIGSKCEISKIENIPEYYSNMVQIFEFRLDLNNLGIYKRFEPIFIEIHQTGSLQRGSVGPLKTT